jgi:16S rRNA (cytosine967-C5)-methyltransferase
MPRRRAETEAAPGADPIVSDKAGLAARRLAVALIEAVLKHRRALDETFERAKLEGRDRAFAYALAMATLRHLGETKAIIAPYLAKPLAQSSGAADTILLTGATQLLFLGTPDHAAIDSSVELAKSERQAARFAGLINAVLRRVAGEGRGKLAGLDAARLNTPEWLFARWQRTYGDTTARAIAMSHMAEPAIDVTVKGEAELWAERLGGQLLETGSIRLPTDAGRIDDLAGFAEGAWWVQDMAAALPVHLFGTVAGKRVLDLCAAPGGKTAQLAAAGAQVTAVDDSPERLKRLEQNLKRLGLTAELRCVDAATFDEGTYDAVLLDAPCSSTGTIRRHPDLPYLKNERQIATLVKLQARMLARAAGLVKQGGLLVYVTCSLEPEEGVEQVEAFLAKQPNFQRLATSAAELAVPPDAVTEVGDLRTLPSMQPGMDGFYAARLTRRR